MPATYAVSRFNSCFNCPEYLSTNGVDFTLHPDKAQRLTFDVAVRWHREFDRATVRSFPTGYESI